MRKLLLLILFIPVLVYGQKVTNVSAVQEERKVVITYDLDRTASVEVYMSEDGGRTYGGALQRVRGDVGKGVQQGAFRRIVWDVLAEREKLVGENICFKVVASAGIETFTVNGVSFKMIKVDGGTFTMGATPEQGGDAYDNEKPAHRVTLSDYYIGQTEVTQALWQAVMGGNQSYFKGDNRPVENVSWNDCQKFIKRLNALTGRTFSLPTEAQWEFAARGGNKSEGYKYAGSNNLGEVAWWSDNSGKETHSVAVKQPNELGLYDMSGNVYEWCSDRYGAYSAAPRANPMGPASGANRVRRGGSWNHYARICRVSRRGDSLPVDRYIDLGLRLVLLP